MEKERPGMDFEPNETKIPGNLDIVCIDGKFFQVAGSKPNLGIFSAFPLSEKGIVKEFDVANFNFEKPSGASLTVKDIKDRLSEDEYKNIVWGPEQQTKEWLKDFVTFFGYYTAKE